MSPSAYSGDVPIGSKSGQLTAGITSTQESVESGSSSALSMPFSFGSDRSASKNPTEPQQTPNDEPHPTQFHFVAEKDGATPPQNSKRPSSAVGTGFVVALQSPRGQQSKRQRTTPAAREDPCCSCSSSASCSERYCPCSIKRVPCTDCDPGSKRCTNTIAAHNLRIDKANRKANNTQAVKFRKHLGLEPRKKLLRIREKATTAGLSDDSDPLDLNNKKATPLFPVTGRGTTVSQNPAIGRIGGDASQSEEGNSASAGENLRTSTPSSGLDNTVIPIAANGQNGLNETRMEGGFCR